MHLSLDVNRSADHTNKNIVYVQMIIISDINDDMGILSQRVGSKSLGKDIRKLL